MHYLTKLNNPKRPSLVCYWLFIMTSLVSTASLADTRWYKVEIVIAQRNDAHLAILKEKLEQPVSYITRGSRVLAKPPLLWQESNDTLAADTENLTGAITSPLNADESLKTNDTLPPTGEAPLLTTDILGYPAFTLLPNKYRDLNEAAEKINESRLYSVLLHQAWVQPLTQNASAIWVDIVSDDNILGIPKVTGTLGMELKRFLHVHTNLINRIPKPEPLDGFLSTRPLVLPLKDSQPDSLLPKNSTHLSPLISYGYNKRTDITQSPWLNNEALFMFVMEQSRKMRSRRLHYLDFPTLALLVRFDPYDPETGMLLK